MRPIAAAVVGLLAVYSFAGARANAAGTEGGKVYVGDEGVSVSVVFLRPRAEGKVLVQLSGTGSEIDGKARLHQLVEEGSRIEYRGHLHGRDFYTLIARDGRYQIYVPGRRNETPVKYDEAKTKALNSEAVLAAYQAQTKDGSLLALERFDREKRVKEAEKELGEEATTANKACGGKIVATVDWSTIGDELLGSHSIASYCAAPLQAMTRLCEAPEARSQLSPIKTLACRFGPALKITTANDRIDWQTSENGSNMEEFAHKDLLGTAPESGQPWGKVESLAEKIALGKTVLCTDGKSHYVVVAPHHRSSWQLYYGTGTQFYSVPRLEDLSGTEFFDPRQFNKTANPNFRGQDFRLISSVTAEREKNTCSVRCGDRTIALGIVPPSKALPMILGADYLPTPQEYRPHVLLRDDLGHYYYVDKGWRPNEEKKLRLWKGPKGLLKEQKMTNVVSDSEGEIFSTKTGSLRLIVDRAKRSVWIEKGKSTTLREVPVAENMPLIYNELGVYLGQRMGTPCDDL